MTDDLSVITHAMRAAGLPPDFVGQVVALARTSEGVADMMRLWMDEPAERPAVVVELQGALDDRAPAVPADPVGCGEAAEALLEERLRHKSHIRALVEAHGGVSRVAAAAGLPQPSLSRFLNTPSEPRPSTLHRLATAMGLALADLAPPAAFGDGIYELPPLSVRSFYRPAPRYGHKEARP